MGIKFKKEYLENNPSLDGETFEKVTVSFNSISGTIHIYKAKNGIEFDINTFQEVIENLKILGIVE